MITTIAYCAVLSATLAYLATYGGKTGQWGGSLLLGTYLLALIVALAIDDGRTRIWMMTSVDVFSLGWKFALAIWSTRRWPIWVAGFQLNVIAAHVSIWLVPSWRGELYYAMITVWAIPTLLAMVIGTLLDQRHEKRVRAADSGAGTI